MNQNSPQDVSALLGDVNELVDNSHCHIDTSHIVSVSKNAMQFMKVGMENAMSEFRVDMLWG